ncbi:MAG TPA: M56 family metallopeptidase [Candidatus Limnocylindria bacterium]|nr:M56 family metallopeptidase [Candidatus Limnocylindria bacterium]
MRADRAFGLVLALALLSSAILVALFVTLVGRAQHLAATGPSDLGDLVAVLVLGLAICGIGLGLATLARQLLATLALIRGLLRRRIPAPARVASAARHLGLTGRVDVVADARPFSFCYWFLRPRICVSTGLVDRLGRDELRAVLLHERYHLRHRDPLRLVIARYFAAGLYVVPVVDELVRHFVLEKELEADEDAVSELQGVGPLARALYKVLPEADDVALGLLLPVGSLSVTEARIDQLVHGRPLRPSISAGAVLLSLGALTAAALLAVVQLEALAGVDGATGASAASAVGPAALLLAAAVSGGLHQLRLSSDR